MLKYLGLTRVFEVFTYRFYSAPYSYTALCRCYRESFQCCICLAYSYDGLLLDYFRSHHLSVQCRVLDHVHSVSNSEEKNVFGNNSNLTSINLYFCGQIVGIISLPVGLMFLWRNSLNLFCYQNPPIRLLGIQIRR